MIFTLGILDPETTFDSSVGFNFFARLFLFLRYLTFLFLRAPFLHRRLLLHRPSVRIVRPRRSPSPAKRERPILLPSSRRASIRALSFRVVAILRPSSILRPRTPLLFPPLFSLPTCRLSPRAPVVSDLPVFFASPETPNLLFRIVHRSVIGRLAPSRYRSRTDSRLCGLSSTISHPVRTDLHRAAEDRIESAPLKRKGDKRRMKHDAFYGGEQSPLSDPQRSSSSAPSPNTPNELQPRLQSSAGFCTTLCGSSVCTKETRLRNNRSALLYLCNRKRCRPFF